MGADFTSVGWTFPTGSTSTGGLKAVNVFGLARQFNVYYEAQANSSATLRMECAYGSSANTYAIIPGTSTTVSTQASVISFTGPFEWIRPYATARTSNVINVRLMGC